MTTKEFIQKYIHTRGGLVELDVLEKKSLLILEAQKIVKHPNGTVERKEFSGATKRSGRGLGIGKPEVLWGARKTGSKGVAWFKTGKSAKQFLNDEPLGNWYAKMSHSDGPVM